MKCTRNIVFFFLCYLSTLTQSFGQCKGLTFEEGVARKLIYEDLFNTEINNAIAICPQEQSGDSALCGPVLSPKVRFDIGLPNSVILTAIMEKTHYRFVKTVFEDKFFIESLRKVPDPSPEVLDWYKEEARSQIFIIENKYGHFGISQPTDSLAWVQKKMLTVLHSVRSWTFCPKTKYAGTSQVHGIYDKDSNIIIYNTACRASKIYAEDISTTALIHRLFFVCAHELSHAIDRMAGNLNLTTGEDVSKAEKRANINGMIITLAMSKLLNQMFIETQDAIRKSPKKMPCDEYYMAETVKRWEKVSDFFENRIEIAKKALNSPNNNKRQSKLNAAPEWLVLYCLEDQVTPQAK
jgi:hypothetical protein